jgi:hypothetical protein
MTDTMIKVAMFLGDNGEAALSRELFAEIERLLADEREKMREMCVKAVKELWREGEEMDERQRGYIRAVRDSTSTIRQLDLTAPGDKGEK